MVKKDNKTTTVKKDDTIQKMLDLEQKAIEMEDKLKRSLADYSNLERRIESQRQLFVTLATTAIISRMIEILDDLHLSQNHLKDPGLQMTIDKFINVLKSEGLEEIDAKDKEFNPEMMEAIDVVDGEPNKVIEIKKKGYSLNGHVIRPVQVAVGRQN